MATLYIDQNDSHLSIKAEVLTIGTQRLPLTLIDRIVARGETHLSTTTLAALAERGIVFTAMGGRAGQRVAHLIGSGHGDAKIRMAQTLTASNTMQCGLLAAHFVKLKLKQQLRTLVQLETTRPDIRKAFFDARATVQHCLQELSTTGEYTISVARARGLEGAAAAAYFQAFFQAFAPSLNVHQRKRRPPPDPVNAMLSLSYALLTSLAVQALWRTGLDPAIGFLHSLAHGRPALACDLIEPRRAEVDLWVQAQFRDRHLRAESFGHDGSGACLLGKAGRAHFYPAWDELARSLYRKMYQHSRHLTHYLTALNQPALAHRLDNDDFDPL